jgi:alkanesulfonate monooxygenase SsuD/methylene tetrahydromethanopterin reductase-like flavin-dependent oxidoreductase (luciferase family)
MSVVCEPVANAGFAEVIVSVQRPHPPVSVAASSVGSHVSAGQRALGAICFENYFGFDYLQRCIDGYAEGLRAAASSRPRATRTSACTSPPRSARRRARRPSG